MSHGKMNKEGMFNCIELLRGRTDNDFGLDTVRGPVKRAYSASRVPKANSRVLFALIVLSAKRGRRMELNCIRSIRLNYSIHPWSIMHMTFMRRIRNASRASAQVVVPA